ncbi:MAG: phosphoglucosamine mutase, partial [Nannocystaceae bacterium]
LDQLDGLGKLVRDIEGQLGNDGRVVMRYSGTEAKLRVMLEGPDEDRLREYAEQIVETAVAELAAA